MRWPPQQKMVQPQTERCSDRTETFSCDSPQEFFLPRTQTMQPACHCRGRWRFREVVEKGTLVPGGRKSNRLEKASQCPWNGTGVARSTEGHSGCGLPSGQRGNESGHDASAPV